ncbi:uncharacterized protein LOC132305517 [Cornus florida]|uniref:uncharacterized protein LOC132305517 n=1 Tax=Cornus florida TaxID=4283 RepID=UPI002896F457|nr:uncharacterized protein LOC132305517 [Cornus florida]
MGGLAVLQPQDCLRDRFSRETLSYPHMKIRRNPNPTKSNSRRKRSPPRLDNKQANKTTTANNKSRHTVVKDSPAKGLVMGQVKLLKRGEDLSKTTVAKDETVDLALSSADRFGPEPETVLKQVRRTDFYAGSASIVSPPPSSLPLPGFVTKTSVLDAATDLRRILRLDLQ